MCKVRKFRDSRSWLKLRHRVSLSYFGCQVAHYWLLKYLENSRVGRIAAYFAAKSQRCDYPESTLPLHLRRSFKQCNVARDISLAKYRKAQERPISLVAEGCAPGKGLGLLLGCIVPSERAELRTVLSPCPVAASLNLNNIHSKRFGARTRGR